MRRHFLVLAAAAAVLASACGGGGDVPSADATPTVAAEADLHVSLERPRYLVLRRMLELILRNEGDAPVTVDRLQLDSPFFTPVDPTVDHVVVPPGDRIDVAIDYGQAVCPGGSEAHAAVLTVNGAPQQHLTLEDADAAIELVHDEECNRLEVAVAADIGFGEDWKQVSDLLVNTTLVVRRRNSTERIVVEELHGGVIFAFATRGRERTPVLTLQPGDDEAAVDVQFKIIRCDPHGMAESKKTYRYPIWVALGDAPGEYVEVEPTGDGRALMERMLSECANGPMGTGQG
jgi:hypothetical protein